MPFRASAPAQNTGYYRASDWAETKGAGPMPNNNVASSNFFSGGLGAGVNGWHPTVAWMLGFVVVELVSYHFLSKNLGF